MARKSKSQDSSSPPRDTPSNQAPRTKGPRVLGWLVLISGGFSTWYWYHPLPDQANEAIHGVIGKSWANENREPKSIWSEPSLIVPSFGSETVPRSVGLVANNSLSIAHTDSISTNIPIREMQEPAEVSLADRKPAPIDLRQTFANERLPLVTVDKHHLSSTPIQHARPWLGESLADSIGISTGQVFANGQTQPSRSDLKTSSPPVMAQSSDSFETASPFRAPRPTNRPSQESFAANQSQSWPDEAFKKEVKPQSPIIANSPKKPSPMVDAAARKIHTDDALSEPEAAMQRRERLPSATINSIPRPSFEPAQEPKPRVRHFIQQPQKTGS